MFGPKIKLTKELFDKVKQFAELSQQVEGLKEINNTLKTYLFQARNITQ